MFAVQRYLVAMSAGACQKNISQSVLTNLPIPSILLSPNSEYQRLFDAYEKECAHILKEIENSEKRLDSLKQEVSCDIMQKLTKAYH